MSSFANLLLVFTAISAFRRLEYCVPPRCSTFRCSRSVPFGFVKQPPLHKSITFCLAARLLLMQPSFQTQDWKRSIDLIACQSYACGHYDAKEGGSTQITKRSYVYDIRNKDTIMSFPLRAWMAHPAAWFSMPKNTPGCLENQPLVLRKSWNHPPSSG
jgi:hypothetical protein